MPSSSITPYYNNTSQYTFALATTSETGAVYKMAGRPLSQPFQVEVQRKITASAATANDHVILRISRIEKNATTGKLATGSVTVDLSIPKDTASLAEADFTKMVGAVASILNECAALQSTTVNAVALEEGRDL